MITEFLEAYDIILDLTDTFESIKSLTATQHSWGMGMGMGYTMVYGVYPPIYRNPNTENMTNQGIDLVGIMRWVYDGIRCLVKAVYMHSDG